MSRPSWKLWLVDKIAVSDLVRHCVEADRFIGSREPLESIESSFTGRFDRLATYALQVDHMLNGGIDVIQKEATSYARNRIIILNNKKVWASAVVDNSSDYP